MIIKNIMLNTDKNLMLMKKYIKITTDYVKVVSFQDFHILRPQNC